MKQYWYLLDPIMELFDKLRRASSFPNQQLPQYRGGGGEYFLLTHPKDWENEKGPWTVGGNSVWTEDVAGIKKLFHAHVQALPNLHEYQFFCPWIRIYRKSCAGKIIPNDDKKWTIRLHKYNNLRQGRNEKPTSIKLMLLTQAQETILVIHKQFQTLQAQINTNKSIIDKKKR